MRSSVRQGLILAKYCMVRCRELLHGDLGLFLASLGVVSPGPARLRKARHSRAFWGAVWPSPARQRLAQYGGLRIFKVGTSFVSHGPVEQAVVLQGTVLSGMAEEGAAWSCPVC